METNVVKERAAFVADFESGHWSMTELCERYGITRPTGYKWVQRAGAGEGYRDRRRAPHRCPHRTTAAIEAQIVAAREQYRWGATKLVAILRGRAPELRWPARSTVNDILDRHALLSKRRRRTRWPHPGGGPVQTARPNQVWPADFKGQFKTGDGRYCYPLTVTDHFSRRLLVCRGLRGVTTAETQPVFRALFRRVGLPDAIRTDNGVPFVGAGRNGLSRLAVWWMQLGIVHQRIRPAQPQENGSHERMHRELKRETTQPAAASLRRQQQRFDKFQARYNAERPHEALGLQTPDACWQPPRRAYPERLLAPEYAAHLEIRKVSPTGSFSLGGRFVFLSEVLAGHHIALEEVDNGIWNIVYYRTCLGRVDQRTGLITGGGANRV
jgi:transposase InsO family protein